MEEKPPWELGCSPYLVKKMKKMEERESGAEERERRSWGFFKKLKKGGYI